MHPAIRIINFLILLGVLAHAQLIISLSILLLAISFFRRDTKSALSQATKLYWRLRWLLLSIVILYLVVIPGTPLIPTYENWQPSREAILLVFQRLVAWWTIVFIFALFSQRTTLMQWQSGIYTLLTPFAVMGLPVEQLLVRMTLTLQAVNSLQHYLLTNTQSASRLTWTGFIARVKELIRFTSDQAEHAPLQTIEINILPMPHWSHWFVPVMLLMAFVLLRWFQLYISVM